MSKYKGNIVSSSATVSSGTQYTGKANGKWSLQEQIQAVFSNLWAKAISATGAPILNTVGRATTSLTANFTAPTTLNGETVLNYTANASPGDFSATGTASPITITGLTLGTSYSITVKANSASGSSIASNAISASPTTATVPSAPTMDSAVAVSPTSARIYFTPSTNDGGDAITGYIARCLTPFSPTTVYSSPSLTSPITITGLTTEGIYVFNVYAINSVGNSPMSADSNYITPEYMTQLYIKGASLLTNSAPGASPRTLSAVGTPQVSTSVGKVNGNSIYFDGVSGLDLSSTINLDGDFTIETWLYRTVTPSGFMIWITGNVWLGFYPDEASFWWDAGTSWTWSPESINNSWYHFALTREGSTVRFFLNGTKRGSDVTRTTAINISRIGCFSGANYGFKGYLDEFRVTKGLARYTSNFTPNTTGFTLD